jgi:hypothetical protein
MQNVALYAYRRIRKQNLFHKTTALEPFFLVFYGLKIFSYENWHRYNMINKLGNT